MRTVREQWIGVAIASISLFVALGGPAAASDAVTLAKKLVTGKQIKDGTITEKDLSAQALASLEGQDGAQGPAGAEGAQGAQGSQGTQGTQGAQGLQGAAGANGSPDTAAQILAKLLTVDGTGSSIDADRLDGQSIAALVADADSAGGDLSGGFSNLQLGTGVVGALELAGDLEDSLGRDDIGNAAVGQAELQSGGTTSLSSVGPFAVAAKTCEIVNVTITGADRGELILPRLSSDLPTNMYVLPSMVSDEDHVQVPVCNGTTGSANLTLPSTSITFVAP